MATEQNIPQGGSVQGQSARRTRQETRQDVQGTTEQVKQKARGLGQRTKQRAGRMVENRKQQVAGRIDDVGERIEQRGERLETQGGVKGRAGRAVHRAGEKVEQGADYLETHSLSTIRDDVRSGIRNHPYATMGAALGTGLIAGWAMSRSGEEEECPEPQNRSGRENQPGTFRRAGKALLGGATAMAAKGIRDRMSGRTQGR